MDAKKPEKKPVGRPRKRPRERRDTVIEVRVSLDERRLLERAAGQQQLSTWIRERALAAGEGE